MEALREILYVAVACCVVVPIPSRAQVPEKAQLQNFMSGEIHRALITRALAAVPPVEFQRCPGLVSPPSRIAVLRPFSFSADSTPEAGLWKESFPVQGCGNDTVLNFYFIVLGDGKINTLIGVPGTTIADLREQHDALFFAQAGAAKRSWMCREFLVSNSFFKGFGSVDPPIIDPGAGAVYRPWWEIWVLNGCGHRYEVTLTFVPDGVGTKIVGPVLGVGED